MRSSGSASSASAVPRRRHGFVNGELDRLHPVRLLIRSNEPADLRAAWRQLRTDWVTTCARMRRTPGVEHESVNVEWSAVQTLRRLVLVHDSWFRRCCLGSADRFTPIGMGPSIEPYRQPNPEADADAWPKIVAKLSLSAGHSVGPGSPTK